MRRVVYLIPCESFDSDRPDDLITARHIQRISISLLIPSLVGDSERMTQ